MKKQLLTITEAAREYSLPSSLLRRLVREGSLPVIMVGTRAYLTRNTLDGLIRGETARVLYPNVMNGECGEKGGVDCETSY